MKNANHISTYSWIPKQIRTSIKLMTGTDYYEQKCLKYQEVGQFHSRAELYFAALLESNPNVLSYVPQPMRFRIGSTFYIPDFYVCSRSRETIYELKSRGKFDEKKKNSLWDIVVRAILDLK